MSGIESVPADRYAHGTRARYVAAQCRCAECRKANAAYVQSRAGKPFNGLVDASKARAHLNMLSAQGVGRRAVAAACDVAQSVIQDIRTGLKSRIRAETERRILAVDAGAAADSAHVSAKDTRAALAEMLRAGLTKTELAARLGSEAAVPSLQLTRRRVTARNALKVQRLLAEVRAEIEAEKRIGSICPECGQSHDKARRLEWLRVHREADRADIIDAQSCWYGGKAGARQLARDMRDLRGEAA